MDKKLGTTPISQTALFSLIYFLLFGAGGILIPFLNLNFYKIGISGIQIGTMTTVRVFVGIFSVVLLCSFFDQTHRKRLTFLLILSISMISIISISRTQSFLLITFLITIYHVGISSTNSILDNLSIMVAESANNNKRFGYGAMRLYGSLSYAIAALTGGMIFEFLGIKINFLLNLIGLGFLTISVLFLSYPPRNFSDTGLLERKSFAPLQVFKILVSNKYLLLLVMALTLTHPLDNGLRHFEPIFMAQLGIRESIIGVAATVSAISEIPFFLWSDRIIKKLGITRILMIVFFIDLMRRLIVFLFPFGWVVFGLNFFTSISFTLRLVTTIKLIHHSFPKEVSTTAMSLITITLFGISNIISVFLSGIVFDAIGGRMLYLISSVGGALSIMFLIIASKYNTESKSQNQGIKFS